MVEKEASVAERVTQQQFSITAFDASLAHHEALTAVDLAIARALSFMVNWKTGETSPGYPISLNRIAAKTRYSRRTVCRSLNRLATVGVVARNRKRKRHVGGAWICEPTDYVLTMPQARDVAPEEPLGVVTGREPIDGQAEPVRPSPSAEMAPSYNVEPVYTTGPVYPTEPETPFDAPWGVVTAARKPAIRATRPPRASGLNGWEHDHLGDLDRNLARVPSEWAGLDAADKHRLRLARAALWQNAGGSLSRVALVTPSMPDDVIDRTIVEWLQKVVFGRQCKTGLQMANALATFIEAKKAVMRDPAWITELIEGAA